MIRLIQKRAKLFICIAALITLLVFVSFGALYAVMPDYYQYANINDLTASTGTLVDRLKKAQSKEECADLISAFARDKSSNVISYFNESIIIVDLSSPFLLHDGEKSVEGQIAEVQTSSQPEDETYYTTMIVVDAAGAKSDAKEEAYATTTKKDSETQVIKQESGELQVIEPENGETQTDEAETDVSDGMSQIVTKEGDGSQAVTKEGDGYKVVTEEGDGSQVVTEEGDGYKVVTEEGDGSQVVTEEGNGSQAVTEEGDGSQAVTEEGDEYQAVTEDGDGYKVVTKEGDGYKVVTEEGDKYQIVMQKKDISYVVMGNDKEKIKVAVQDVAPDQITQAAIALVEQGGGMNSNYATITQEVGNGLISRIEVTSLIQPVNEAKSVMMSLMPPLLAVNILIALTAAYLYVRKVEQYEQSKVDFMRAAGHELKTPIAALSGILEGMTDQVGVYKDRDKYLKESIKLTGKMAWLVREILNASKEEKSVLAKAELGEVIDETLSSYGIFMEEKGLTVIREAFEYSCTTDRKLLDVVISNLISNAVHYTASGGTVRISFTASAKALSIENTCQMIEEDKLARLFEPFYTLDDSRDRSRSGTGLGLYIVKRNLETLKLKHQLENTNEGIKFTIFF